jgi:PAS domain S-box-containing protein
MNTALIGSYNYRLVALSVCIAIVAAYAALDLAGRITTARGKAQFLWLACGSIAMGLGIWAMHYIGMEAFNLPDAVDSLIQYDWPTVLLSVFIAILASAVALYLVSRPTMGRSRTILGSIVMGSGISAMHYIGMEAMRLPAMCIYSPKLIVLSVVLSILISYLALRLTFSLREDRIFLGWRRAGGGLLLGLAIPIMHYSGMAAVHFMPMGFYNGSLAHAVSVSNLELGGITGITLAILALVFISSIVDRRFALQSRQFAESSVQLQAVFDNMSEAIVVVDPDRQIFQHNRAATELLRREDRILSLQSIFEDYECLTLAGAVLAREDWPISLAMRGDFRKNTELIIRRKDNGSSVEVEVSTIPIPALDGRRPKIIASFFDIGKRKLMDEVQARQVAIVEFSEDAIIGKNDQGIVTSWNKGAEKIFGYTAAEMIGQSIKILLPEGHAHEEEEILARIKRGEIVDHIESTRKRKDGKLINVSLSISPIRDSWGKVIGASKIARDITEKRQLERQLHQSQKMEAIGQLTGGIAHDFNNLLGVVIGNLDLLETLIPGNEDALKRVRTAQKGALRGADLIRRLLAFSSNEELRPSVVKLHYSIRNMMELAARAIGPEIKVNTHFDESLPPVFVDAAGLESSLLNLVVNARDAMPKGGSINITTQLSNLEESYPPVKAGELKAGRYACVSISDTGTGMSRETIERAFEPFFTTKPRGKGTGLGLAMVYGFVKQSGGTVRIYSESGYGTTVSFYLPLAEGMSLPVNASKVVSSAKRSGTVLVVDDEPDLLDIAVAYLAELGYTALQAQNGADALQVIAQHPEIDLVMTDIIMPGGMNGVELAQKVRQLYPAIKIIYSSGFPADVLAERSMPLVDGPLLHKPYQRITFGAMIRFTMEDDPANDIELSFRRKE